MFVVLALAVSLPVLWLGYGHYLVRRFQAHYLAHGTCIECSADSMVLNREKTVPGEPDAYYACQSCGAELYLDESCTRRIATRQLGQPRRAAAPR